ncbi:MAG: FimV/HubP family polar landmark protein [Gammaproteobacteria bacterium]
MGKLIVRAIGSVLLLVPAISFALGLGPITMRSSLNQPLDAEIDIHSAQPGDLDGFAVRLASPDDFARVNVERSPFLSQIQFKLKFRNDGSAYIHLTSQRSVTEPYLDFLIEARWPRGRALKEYTVLVDPPVLTAETPKPVQQPGTEPVFTEREQAQTREPVRPRTSPPPRTRQQIARPTTPPPVRRAPPPPAPQPRVAETPTGDVQYGRVKRGDTLWEIARDTRPNNSVSIHQMMLAYLRDNPDAFIDGNINKLKAGYVLRIDDASTIASTSRRQAIDEVRRQNLAWREGRGTRVVKQTEPEGDSRVSSIRDEVAAEQGGSTQTAKAGDESARLKLVAPGEGEGSGGAAGEDSESAKVKENLLLATEALDATNQEAEELDNRMAELDEQLQSMERLINLKDEELVALQNTLGKQPDAQAAAPKADKKQAAAKQSKPKKEQAKDESIIPDELLSDPILLGLAGLLVVAVVGWLVVRRRRMHDGFDESILNVGVGSASVGAASAEEGGPESAMVSDFVMSDMPGAQVDATEVDAISEADVYLAYGRHQQAEDILRQALDKAPDQLDLQAKLLEVFHAAKNADAFEEQARLLHEKIGGDESNSYWMDIAPLGREICPHSDLFGGSGGAGADDTLGAVSADEEDLLDFDFNANDDLGDIAADSGGGNDLDEALDFDMSSLDMDMDMGGDEPAEQAPTPDLDSFDSAIEEETHTGGTDDGGLDFDLSFDEDHAASSSAEPEPLEMETAGGFETELSDDDNSIDFGGLDMDLPSESQQEEMMVEDDDAPLELSLDDSSDDNAVGGGDDMSMDFDQGADIVQLDTGGGSDIDLDGELDEDIFSNVDEVGTKLDLAKAYVDMGDSDGARSILDEVLEEGDDTQKQQAEELLQQMG